MRKKEFLRHFIIYFIVSFITIGLYAYTRIAFVNSESLILEQHVGQSIIEFGKYKILLIITLYVSLLLALTSTFFDVFVMKRFAKDQKLWILFVIGFLVDIIIISTLIHFSNRFSNRFLSFITDSQINTIHQKEIIPMTLHFLFTLFLGRLMIEVDKKLGPGNLWKMITGKFMKPREEDRVFMFVDMKNSTAIAEKIGHLKFSSLIQDCFYDFSIVDKFDAEIYQYVGDEVVISWSVDKGLLNNNILESFFAFQQKMESKKLYYEKKYGFLPTFKCGLYAGPSIVTEVGEIKKEISYHGDTINTASRIQEMCNAFDAQMLIPEALFQKVKYSYGFTFENVGCTQLKGKTQEIDLYRVTKN
ncbi:MAG: adenylate/guanylate cyclase domain-containing protein [Flavobacteriales bacterium]